jgi:hypothetical protein
MGDERSHLSADGRSVAIWGLGLRQPIRCSKLGRRPPLTSPSGALNTVVLADRRALGSAAGGVLYARDQLRAPVIWRWILSRWRFSQ